MLITILRGAGPAFILLGSVMTAANRGARFTGWGFVAFFAGSASFFSASALSGDVYGMVMNGLLACTGAYGMHRWLGHKARGEDAASQAERKSAQSPSVATVMSATKLLDARLFDDAGNAVGKMADFLVAPESADVAYFVCRLSKPVNGTHFCGIAPANLKLCGDKIRLTCALSQCHPLAETDWPACLPGFDMH